MNKCRRLQIAKIQPAGSRMVATTHRAGCSAAKPPLPIAALHRQLYRIAMERGQPAPNYKAVYRVVRHLPADLVMLAHEGSKAYRDVFELIHRREADRPNAIWQADHTLLDIMLVRDGTKPVKPWLTVIQDDHSRAVAGYFLSFVRFQPVESNSTIDPSRCLHLKQKFISSIASKFCARALPMKRANALCGPPDI